MRHETKNFRATASSESLLNAPGSLEAQWHYVTIDYEGRELGLLVGTDDEEEARREAQELCNGFDAQAKVLWVRKVILQ